MKKKKSTVSVSRIEQKTFKRLKNLKVIKPKKIPNNILTQAQMVGIMEPDTKYGYTDAACKIIFSKREYAYFQNWMSGQTCGQDPETGKFVSYTYDVTRCVNILRHNGIDIWD